MSPPTRGQLRALVALVLVSLALVTLDVRGGSFAGARTATRSVFGPVQAGLTTVVGPVGRFLATVPHLGRDRGRVRELEARTTRLERELHDARLTGGRSAELERLRLLAGLGQYRVLPAAVVALSPSLGFEWTVTVDAGGRDGVRAGQTVVTGDGLVGRVKQVTAGESTIVLALDPGSSVGVRVEGSGQLGVVAGNGVGPLRFSPLDPQTRVRVGDRLVTGPYGGTTYTAGVPVGEVVAVSAAAGSTAPSATVRPFVHYTTLDLVGIVLAAPRTDPRDSVLPPRPTPARTPAPTRSPAGTPTTGTPAGPAPGNGTSVSGSSAPAAGSAAPRAGPLPGRTP